MSTNDTRPRLVFFQRRYAASLPTFLRIHLLEHAKCLAQFFDLTIINEDCDYLEVCDKHRPDLAIFESGPNLSTSQRLRISNVRSNSDVPKLGLFNSDGWSETRAGILSEMDGWGIENFVSIAVTASEHTPSIADRLIVWPNFIDPVVYHDYCEKKTIPVFLTGASASQYPWRQRVAKLVVANYPSLQWRHPGYYDNDLPALLSLHGERYARAINSSMVAPTCGTVAKEVVRKHFEIPACKACLVTEESPGLAAAGFVDMVNCVFADQSSVLDKLDFLFRNPAELERITEAGYQLVHARHTINDRDQIWHWLRLYREKRSGQKIIQPNPFERPKLVAVGAAPEKPYIVSNGLHLAAVRRGDEFLRAGDYLEAEKCYEECLGYTRMLPEAKLRLALCSLHLGKPLRACEIVSEPIQYVIAGYRVSEPDPVEWAYFVISVLCQGRTREAALLAKQFSSLRHPVLDRCRIVVRYLRDGTDVALTDVDSEGKVRPSVHALPSGTFDDWLDDLRHMLVACRQPEVAGRLGGLKKSTRCGPHVGPTTTVPNIGPELAQPSAGRRQLDAWRILLSGRIVAHLSGSPVIYFRTRQKVQNILARIRRSTFHAQRRMRVR